jgi:hypothetical protein
MIMLWHDPVGAPLFKHLRDRRGQEPIDPVKVARVLLDVAEMAEDARWAELGQSVDFA